MSEAAAEILLSRAVQSATKKSQAVVSERPQPVNEIKHSSLNALFRLDHEVTPSRDILMVSKRTTELTPEGERVPSRLIVSPRGREVIHQNPGFLSNLLEGKLNLSSFPNGEQYASGDFSFVSPVRVSVGDTQLDLVVKVHDEGTLTLPHFDTSLKVMHDKLSGIDEFLALRAVRDLSTHPQLSAPEPILATQRLMVAELIHGEAVPPQDVPKWVKQETKRDLDQAYEKGWFKRINGDNNLQRKHRIDFYGKANVLIKDNIYYVIDPIRADDGRKQELLEGIRRRLRLY